MNNDIIEKELKVLNIDPKELKKKLSLLGGRKILDCLTYMKWFDHDSRRGDVFEVNLSDDKCLNESIYTVLSEALNIKGRRQSLFREAGVYFRLRREGEVSDLTLKHKQDNVDNIIYNREVACKFSSEYFVQVEKIITAAGFVCIAEHQKKRTSFLLKINNSKVRVDIDRWPGIPPYAEIEGQRKDDIKKVLDLLDLDDIMISTKIGKEFFEMYGIDFFSDLKFCQRKAEV